MRNIEKHLIEKNSKKRISGKMKLNTLKINFII